MTNVFRRNIHPQIRVLDDKAGVVEYVASNETLDSYREVIRAAGWRFTHFSKNSPFLDSHKMGTIETVLGKVIDFVVKGKNLIESVQWAIDVPTNTLAQRGYQMTKAGYLPAVSVGFQPVKWVTQGEPEYQATVREMGIDPSLSPRRIFLEQEQVELSAVVIGANPDALARSYKAGILTDADLDMISLEQSKVKTANTATDPADAVLAQQRAQTQLLERLYRAIGTM